MREANLQLDESDFGTLGIGELVSLYREAKIRSFEELACRGDGAVVQVTVESVVDEAVLSDLACVDWWDRFSGAGDTYVYVVEFTAPALPEELVESAEDLLGTCDPDVHDDGFTMSLVGPQGAIAGAVSEYEASGVSPDVRKLGGYDGGTDPMDGLTDRQREVIQTAYDMGYYEVPREAATADVAAALDVDPSTIAEHLQRAERNLLRHHL